jgi:hypothetical protein
MFSQAYHSSTEEESSDEDPTSTVSDTPSKATGTDSWYDVKSDTEQPPPQTPPQQLKQLVKTKNTNVNQQIVKKEDEDDDEEEEEEEEDDDDVDDKDRSLIKSINDIYLNGSTTEEIENDTFTGNDHHHNSIANTHEQQIQNGWMNPYWSTNWKPVTTVTQTTVKEYKVPPDIQQ